ncbi:peptidase M61 [Flavobacteriaceae bacterium XHP0103]|uniref:M61 family metallopeptidase n=1 Tax=Marixanthotalea marina TaxID=2844359 RepID=UPI002989E9E3|nr:peptidase M61 [Marixanthotalea marina]MBU3822582.1 peptidase M61 [Marixanthotalea marina]
MKTRILAAFFAVILLASCGSSRTSTNDLATALPIETSLDLTKIDNDRVPVTIDPGRFTVDNVTYRLPKVVQGTYSVSNFGSYVDDFKAYDYKGNELAVVKADENTWTIANAKQLDKITYLVNDTFDMEEEGGIGKEQPFSPSGTNIETDNYVLNLHGFLGYFDSLKNNQYKVDVTAPTDFKRSSALQQTGTKSSDDGSAITTSYIAPRYFDITDNPMMYGNLTVEEFQVGDIKIVLSVYSPNNAHSAQSLKSTIFKMMQAQKAFLGDINATPRYDVFLYLSDRSDEKSPKGFGALEHHKSTVVVMPEDYPDEQLAEGMIDVVSHEFFHIVTPLSIHSEDIHYFDYNNPTFSKHLWMYEGVTEYFATLFQVSEDLVPEEEFYTDIMDKITRSLQLDDTMSFTKMSENILTAPYKDQYLNVYQKGALIGMCVDILMREESNGQRGILSLMKELSNKYGVNKPFEDDKLIEEITAMTYPSIGAFLNTHVVGTTPIDYSEFFDKVGLEIAEAKIKANFVFNGGNMIFGGNSQYGTIFFTEAVTDNSFWANLGAQPGDIIKNIDGTDLTMQNANDVLQNMFMWEMGQDIKVVLERKGEEVILEAKTEQSYTTGEKLQPKPNATPEQVKLREAWLKG